MQFPNNAATRLTERIMARIWPHLKEQAPPPSIHHYNRVYEAVYAVLSEKADARLEQP